MSRRTWLSRFLTSCSGASAVEFALIVSVFMMILFGIMTAGWIFFLQNNLETAARAAARHMAVWDAVGGGIETDCVGKATDEAPKIDCPPGETSANQATAENVACTWFPQMERSAVRVTAADCCFSPTSLLCAPLLDNTFVVAEVSVNLSDAALLDFFGFFDGVTMRGYVKMRREEGECSPP